jgi:REP element-mobilizing transposase RayT
MVNPKTISFSRRKLPHWQVVNRPYFITFRLKGSLPHSVIDELKIKKEALVNQKFDSDELYQYNRYIFKRIEAVLDNVNNNDNCFLTKSNIASLIMNAFEFIEQKYCWRFPHFVIMPNHVHCLAVVTDNGISKTLNKSIGCLKGYVAKESNRILGKHGQMWADENFDHWCRTPGKVEGVIRYIQNNPVKAQLVKKIEDWPWGK